MKKNEGRNNDISFKVVFKSKNKDKKPKHKKPLIRKKDYF